MDLSGLQISFRIIMPEITLAAFGILVLLVGVFSSPKDQGKDNLGYISIFGVILALIFSVPLFGEAQDGFSGMVVADNFAAFFKVVLGLICLLTILMSIGYIRQRGIGAGEYYALLLFSTLGMMLMASGTNLLTIFLGLETMSLSIYVLAGIVRNDPKSIESAMKYFILGAFATGFFLYGVALIYGSTGSFNLKGIASYISASSEGGRNALLIIGIALLTIGFGFKISTVPFHMWTPDVYEGAPTSITAFMATGVKAAAFAGFVRVFYSALGAFQPDWTAIMWLLSVATMTGGNIVAISQSNIKRMLAYSSIAHAGYILVAFTAGNDLGISSILFYLLAYAFMNIGAFTVVILLGRKGEENTLITDYSGIGFKYPLLAASMTIFMLSLAGIPPLAGFMGKFYIFSAAVKAKFYWLAVIGVLNSALSVYYYLRVTVHMYFREAEKEIGGLTFSPAAVVSLIIAVAGVFYLGIFPSTVLALARASIGSLM
jgi:NADH-quinone oxidoreductase subunit N